MARIVAPWTDEQVEGLNRWQTAGIMHPYTCANRNDDRHPSRAFLDRGTLLATPDGWVCPDCDYTQNWAHG
jgi:hypothetical protein